MSETICGHDVEVLKWALSTHVDEDLPSCGCESAKCQAQLAVDDPSKLAAILAELLREIGLRVSENDALRDAPWLVYADEEDGVSIVAPLFAYMLTMPQARSLILAILESDRKPETVLQLVERV